jgi:hypothetical protein
MWRVLRDVIVVVVIGLLLLYVSLPPLDGCMNISKVSKALRAREENPTAETQRALRAALSEGDQECAMRRMVFSLSILFVTGSGLFIAGRGFERRRWLALNSTAPNNAAPRI